MINLDDLLIIHAVLVNAQHDGADCDDLADGLHALDRVVDALPESMPLVCTCSPWLAARKNKGN